MDEAVFQRMLPLFLDDALRQMETMDAALLALAVTPADSASRLALQRAAHTLRGNAAALELGELANDADTIEELTIAPPGPIALAVINGSRGNIRRALAELRADVGRGCGRVA